MYAWADDPYTLGAYVAWDDVSWDRARRLARPLGRVVFAGEHTAGAAALRHDGGRGAERRRAAEQVLAALG